MSDYVERCIELCKAKNPGEVEFHQTVEEVLTSLVPVIEQHPEYEECALLERLTEPERGVTFRVVWVDDEGKVLSDLTKAVSDLHRTYIRESSSSSASSRSSRTALLVFRSAAARAVRTSILTANPTQRS